MTIYKLQIIFASLVFLGLSSCDEDLPPSIKINKEIFSEEDQIKLGDIFVEQYALDNIGKVLNRNQYVKKYNYVESFNLFLTPSVSRREIFNWDISIVKDVSKNAFCFPGGHIYLTTGLLKFIENESQLVAIIANQIYYAESDILVNKLVRNYDGVTMGDVFLGNEPDDFTLTEIVSYLTEVKFDMRDIMDADEFGLDVVCNFEYLAMSIVEVIENAEDAEEFFWLNRHPASAERLNSISSLIDTTVCSGIELFEERYNEFKIDLP